MAEKKPDDTEEKKPSAFKKFILLILLLGAGGGGAAAAGYAGLIPLPFFGSAEDENLPDLSKTVFIRLPKITIPLGESAKARYLSAKFSIETEKPYQKRVEALQPRLMDMFNTYLRAVEEKQLIDPGRFQSLQAQMLRRARLVAGDKAIKNILVQEFILQ